MRKDVKKNTLTPRRKQHDEEDDERTNGSVKTPAI